MKFKNLTILSDGTIENTTVFVDGSSVTGIKKLTFSFEEKEVLVKLDIEK